MANWISATFHHDGLDLHYVRTGGDKPPLILLHGLAASGACWTPFARLFEDEYDVVMPDARGHGKSGAPLHGYGYQDHARDVVALISQLGLSAPILLGHSMGGMTAATVAGEGLQELTSVILVDPTFIGPELQRAFVTATWSTSTVAFSDSTKPP
jgi:pimeloyl-ACP methyl ester carboxylesterase